MIITVEKHVLSLQENTYVFIVNQKHYTISKSLYDNFTRQYFNAPRNKRYEYKEETFGSRYTYDISEASWATVKPKYQEYIKIVKKYIAEGFTGQELRNKLTSL